MGLANLVPGISGGTMLLAVGIYPRFIEAVARVTSLRLDRGTVVTLGSVVPAALAAIVLLAGPVKDLVVGYRWIMYSLFIGLTLGGVPVILSLIRQARMGPEADRRRTGLVLGAMAGFIAMALLALLQARGAGGAENEGWLIFFTGGLAGAGAMILPGVSGGYLLLILGAYVPILGAVEAFREALSSVDVAAILSVGSRAILPVALGVIVGIAVVSHLLRWLFTRYRLPTLGVLLGLLVGAVVGLWPFQTARLPEPGELIKGRAVEVVEGEAEGSPFDAVVRYAGNQESVDLEDLPTTFFTPTPVQSGLSLLLIGLGFAVTVGISRLGTGSR
jgi:putative membrane protein